MFFKKIYNSYCKLRWILYMNDEVLFIGVYFIDIVIYVNKGKYWNVFYNVIY